MLDNYWSNTWMSTSLHASLDTFILLASACIQFALLATAADVSASFMSIWSTDQLESPVAQML